MFNFKQLTLVTTVAGQQGWKNANGPEPAATSNGAQGDIPSVSAYSGEAGRTFDEVYRDWVRANKISNDPQFIDNGLVYANALLTEFDDYKQTGGSGYQKAATAFSGAYYVEPRDKKQTYCITVADLELTKWCDKIIYWERRCKKAVETDGTIDNAEDGRTLWQRCRDMGKDVKALGLHPGGDTGFNPLAPTNPWYSDLDISHHTQIQRCKQDPIGTLKRRQEKGPDPYCTEYIDGPNGNVTCKDAGSVAAKEDIWNADKTFHAKKIEFYGANRGLRRDPLWFNGSAPEPQCEYIYLDECMWNSWHSWAPEETRGPFKGMTCKRRSYYDCEYCKDVEYTLPEALMNEA